MTQNYFLPIVAAFQGREMTFAQIRNVFPGQAKNTLRNYILDAIKAGKLERVNPHQWIAIYREAPHGTPAVGKPADVRSIVEKAVQARTLLEKAWA